VQQRRTIGALLSGDAHGHGGFGVGAFEKADDPSHLFPEDRCTMRVPLCLASLVCVAGLLNPTNPNHMAPPTVEDYDRELRDDHEEMGSRQFLVRSRRPKRCCEVGLNRHHPLKKTTRRPSP